MTPKWVTIETVIELNRELVAATGEHHFLRDRGLLEGALARPQHAFSYGEEDIVALAVRLMAGIVQSHAFEQGNKRTGFAAMRLFLVPNGYELSIEDQETWADAINALIERRLTETDFATALRPHVVPIA